MTAQQAFPGDQASGLGMVVDTAPARADMGRPRMGSRQGRISVCVLETVSIGRGGDVPTPIGSMQQKVMLTLLVAYANRSVSVDRIADELWGQYRPTRWLEAIRTLANSLRRVADDRDFIHWTGRGYRLHKDLHSVETDIDRMLGAIDEARAALDKQRFDSAEEAARRALSFYGGGPWTTDCWYWSDVAADAYCLLGRSLLARENYIRCLVELSRAPEELHYHDGLSGCLERARQAVTSTSA